MPTPSEKRLNRSIQNPFSVKIELLGPSLKTFIKLDNLFCARSVGLNLVPCEKKITSFFLECRINIETAFPKRT